MMKHWADYIEFLSRLVGGSNAAGILSARCASVRESFPFTRERS